MTVIINGKHFFRTAEACKRAGISRATFFRWIKDKTIDDVSHKDRRGWRLFTDKDIERLRREVQRLNVSPSQQSFDYNGQARKDK